MTVLESLKNRARFLIAGGVSFALVLGVTRAIGGSPLIQPQSDIGVVIGLALVALYFVINDTRGASGSDRADTRAKTGLN